MSITDDTSIQNLTIMDVRLRRPTISASRFVLPILCFGLLSFGRGLALEITIMPGQTLAANAEAMAAFERAAEQWENLLQDPIQIRIAADLTELSSGVIAQASSNFRTYRYDSVVSAIQSDASDELDDDLATWLPSFAEFDVDLPEGFDVSSRVLMTSANAKALGFSGFGLSRFADGTINFSQEMDFDFDNSDGVDRRAVDFETTVAHEIGHVLGFLSAVDDVDVALDEDRTPIVQPTPLDLFRFASEPGVNPESESDFTTFARSLTAGGNPILDFLDRGEIGMSSGESQGDGYQAGHWEALPLNEDPIGLMQPSLPDGQVVEIGKTDLLALDMIGWDYDLPQPSRFQAGDSDLDLDFDQFDLVMVLQSSKYLTGLAATWGEGDWDGARGAGDRDGDPPQGDGVFDQVDVVSALSTGNYQTGPYSAWTEPLEQPVDFPHLIGDAKLGDASLQLSQAEGLVATHELLTVPSVLVCEPQPNFLAVAGAILVLLMAKRRSHWQLRVTRFGRRLQ